MILKLTACVKEDTNSSVAIHHNQDTFNFYLLLHVCKIHAHYLHCLLFFSRYLPFDTNCFQERVVVNT